jgi:type IV pilus assembly protein PilV
MKNNTGFSLIEVLIAMVILAVGLLGLAALQASSLKNNQTAYYRSQATQMVYDIADRMRANRSSGDKYLSSFMAVKDAKKHADCLTVSTTCTPAMMAEHDLYEWKNALINLPSGSGKIEKIGISYKVTLSWDEKRDDNRDNEPGVYDKPTVFEMGFQL